MDKAGLYVAQLIANDGTVDSAPDTVSISTENSAPVANAGMDQTVHTTETVQLDGSGSSDVDGDPLTYFWSMISKPAESEAVLSAVDIVNPTFVADKDGDYIIQLIVNDGTVGSAPDTVTISTFNSKPVADAGPDQSVILGTLVALDGSASYDADSDPLTYDWSVISKPEGSTAELDDPASLQPSFTPDRIGTYLIQLIVGDGIQNSDPDSVVITVSAPANQAPVAGDDAYAVDEDTTLMISAPGVLANDYDPDGNSMTTQLAADALHGTLTLNPNGSFTYVPALNYHGPDSFAYTATDGLLVSNTATVGITINSVNDAPVADAGGNQTVAAGDTVQLNGAASSDPDGDALTYQWTMVSKPAGSAAMLSNAGIVNPTFVADKAGTYEIRLVVHDGTVASAPDMATIDAVTGNRLPQAQDISVNIADNAPVTIILKASDPDGDSLTFSTSTSPAHGTLSGTPPLLTYTPASGYLGTDSFTYQADDGKGGTDTATVAINICLSANGLAAYFPFNGNANDESGNGNNGTVNNATLIFDRDGNPGSAYSFDGEKSYIEVGSVETFEFANSLSLDVWINPVGPGSDGGGVIAGKENKYLLARYADGTIRVAIANTDPGWQFINTGYVAPLYQWTRIVLVYDAGVIKVYANGVLVYTYNGSGPITMGDFMFGTPIFRVGNRELYNIQKFDGIIDEVRVYNRALTEQEIQCGACMTSNRPPRITSMPITAAGINHQYSYQVMAHDLDGDSLAYTLPLAPSGMTVDEGGLIRWTPGAASDFQVLVQVSDGFGGSDSQNFWIRVGEGNSAAVNAPPIAHGGDDFTVEEGKADQLDGSHSYDADGDHLTYMWTQIGGPAVDLDSNTVQKPKFTAPHVDRNTLLTFELVVNDGYTDSAPAKINVMVLNMNIWPDGSGMVTNCNAEGPGSLKAAVDYANSHPGTRITFSIPDTEPCYEVNTPGVWSLSVPVRLSGAYTAGIIINADGTFFDGASQTENQGDRNPYGPEIELMENTVALLPFMISASDAVIRGVVLNRQPKFAGFAPTLMVAAGQNAVIIGNYIGTDATGTDPIWPDYYNECHANGGLKIAHVGTIDYTKKSPIHNLRIGGSRPGEGNLISVFSSGSIRMDTMFDGLVNPTLDKDAPGPVTIQGNLIGVDRTGTRALTHSCLSAAISIDQAKDVLIGGVTPGSRNIISGSWQALLVQSAQAASEHTGDITVQGNYIGTDITGTVALGSIGSNAIGLGASEELDANTEWIIGGSIPGAGNVIVLKGDNGGAGIVVYDSAGAIPSIKIQGNYIGTDASGTAVLGTGQAGIVIGGGRVLVGGTGPGEGNVIGGQKSTGISISGLKPSTYFRPSSIEVKGNRIGLGADGITPIPNNYGIITGTNFPLVIGGTEPGAGNIIVNSLKDGIQFAETWGDNGVQGWIGRVLGNRVYDNGGQGIIRGSGRVNDPGDADYGWPLDAQNYPVIKTVEVINGATQIRGILDTPSPDQCLIEIFANREADPSGFGEAEEWVTSLYPDADGSFNISIPQDLSGKYLAATATRMTGRLNSSQLSPAVLAGTHPSTNRPPAISSSPVTSATTETAYSYQVVAADPEGQPLRYALALAPEGMTIDGSGLISWTPTAQQTGKQVVTVVAYDPEGLYGSQNFTIRSEPLVDVIQPVVSPALPGGLTISTPYQITGTICDSHLVGYAIEVAPSGTGNFVLMASGNACVENGVLGTIDPTRLANGTYVVRFTAWDEAGNLTVFSSSEPVEIKGKLKIGQFSLAFQDISIPVSGIPINVIRSYNSFNKNQGDFGVGWDMGLGTGVKVQVTRPLGSGWRAEEDGEFLGTPTYKLANDNPAKILVTYADGRQDRFQFAPDFVTIPRVDPTWVNPIIKALEGTTSTLEVPGMTQPVLCPSQYCPTAGGIMELDPDNPDIAAVYNPDLFKLTTADGMVLMLSRTEGLKSLTDRNGNTVTFSASGMAHSAGLSIDMQRDFKDRITKVTDPMGRSVSYVYNANGDLASFKDQAGNVTKYGYDSEHNLISIIDPRGIEILKVQYDAEGRMIGTVDGLGKITEITHDTGNAIEYVRDRRGNLTTYEYDPDGNIITHTDPLGKISRFTYDANGNQLSKTDPLGNTWTFTYDSKDNKLSETDPLGNTKRWTYNSTGDVLTYTDANGNTEVNTYDGRGNLITKTVPSGAVFTFAYDSAGNVVSLTDHYGKVTLIENDGFGHITKMTDPVGRVTTYSYDANGNRTEQSTTRSTDGGPVIVTYTTQYNSINNPVLYRDPEGKQISLEYNSIGQISAKVDRNGNRFEYFYNANGQPSKVRYPDATEKIYTVDAEGNRVSETDRGGRTTQFEYDANNRLIRTVFADGNSKQVEYDAAGRVQAEIDENGRRTEYAYDKAGRRTKMIDPAGHETLFAYDGNGNQVSVTDPNGNTTGYEYNALNQLVKTTFPDGTATTIGYDLLGRKISETDQAGAVTHFEYDSAGRLTKVLDALGGEMAYEYDEIDNKISQTDPNGHVTRWKFDSLGRALKRILPLGMEETFTYDGRGNVLTRTNFKGETVTFAYNSDNRVTGIAYPDGSNKTFAYNPTGTRKTATDASGTISYGYDLRDRLASVANPGGKTITYTYDAKGNRTTMSMPSGSVAYTYDLLDRLHTVTDPDGGLTEYTYDPAGNLRTIRLPNGITTTRTYNSLNRLVGLESRKSDGELVASYAYSLAPNGNRTRIEEGSGRVVNYTYDALSRLIQEEINDPFTGSRTIGYTYDAFGNRLTKNDSATGVTSYAYDANDRLLTETAPDGTTSYSYDPNGNLTAKSKAGVNTLYSYSPENRLLEMDDGSTQTAYAYDPDGLRVRSVKNGTLTVHHLLDKALPYAQVVQQTNGSGVELARYIYGTSLLSMKRPEAGTRYYTSDGLGSTRQLTDSAQSVTDSYDYDGFGNLIQSAGATANQHLFAGEQYDPELAMYYLRARYYDPTTGRFAEMDPISGDELRPLSQNRYIYAEANPVMNIDPSGQFVFASYMSGGFMRDMFNAARAVYVSKHWLGTAVKAATALAIAYGLYKAFGKAEEKTQKAVDDVNKSKGRNQLRDAEIWEPGEKKWGE